VLRWAIDCHAALARDRRSGLFARLS
jgi:hypothetical protein